jgi:hypothetical protein
LYAVLRVVKEFVGIRFNRPPSAMIGCISPRESMFVKSMPIWIEEEKIIRELDRWKWKGSPWWLI